MGRILDLHCLKSADKNKLIAFGISSTARLLLIAADRGGRELVAAETGIDEARLLETVHLADLMRVNGIGAEYAALLGQAGVRTLKQLARRSPDRLFTDLQALNAQARQVRRMPASQDIATWVEAAGGLESRISH